MPFRDMCKYFLLNVTDLIITKSILIPRTSGVDGLISIDRKHSCYITQEDHHQTLLSVEELMNLACDLKLKRSHQQNKTELIAEILDSLNLNHRRNVNANDLSGGERKRLSVALELVANPKIFFLDEPTSGLDEVTAAQCIRLLRSLAQRGHTVVCTIHQPSATIFNYFDNVYVLAKGKCVYQGSPRALVSYLSHADKECPKHYSPADYSRFSLISQNIIKIINIPTLFQSLSYVTLRTLKWCRPLAPLWTMASCVIRPSVIKNTHRLP